MIFDFFPLIHVMVIFLATTGAGDCVAAAGVLVTAGAAEGVTTGLEIGRAHV